MKYKLFLKDNPGLIVYLFILAFTSVLFIYSLFIGGVTMDELDGLHMVTTHFRILENNIPLGPDPTKQALVYYGIVHLLPAYFLSTTLGLGSFFPISHFTFFIMSLVASYYVFKISIICGLRKNFAYLAAALLLIYPLWLGHSFFNDKDIPAGVLFTVYTYYACRLLNDGFANKKRRLFCTGLIVAGALLAAVKIAFFPAILVNSIIIAYFYRSTILDKLYLLTDVTQAKPSFQI